MSSAACVCGTDSSCWTRRRIRGQSGKVRRAEMEKGGDGRPLFLLRARSAYRFLPAFFFPPLAFFAIVCYPPLHVGFTCENAHVAASVAAAWHAHPAPAAVASWHLPLDSGRARSHSPFEAKNLTRGSLS